MRKGTGVEEELPWRQQKGAGLPLEGAEADDLAPVVDPFSAAEQPSRVRRDEVVEVHRNPALPQDGAHR